MKNTFCIDKFNQGFNKRRTNPKADGGPDIDDIGRTGDALFSGICELNYQLRNGLPLQSYHQEEDDAYWANEMLGIMAYRLGYDVLPAIQELARSSKAPNTKKIVASLRLRMINLINQMDVANDALWEHGICERNSAWLADGSDLLKIPLEYNQILKEARALV